MSYPAQEPPGVAGPQNPYATQPYGAIPGQAPGVPLPYGSPGMTPPPPAGSNGMSIAAIILAFLVSPLGIVFSVLGIVRAGKLAGRGRVLSIVALVISVLGSIGWVAFGVGVGEGVKQVVTCSSTESQVETIGNKIQADQNDPAAYKQDLQDIVDLLNTSAAKVSDAKSATDMRKAAADFQELLDAETAHTSPPSDLLQRLTTDGDAVDADCS